MKLIKDVFENLKGHEKATLSTYNEYDKNTSGVYAFDALPKAAIKGLPISSKRINGKLYHLFSEDKGHNLIIGSSGSGKTTGWIFPYLSAIAKNCSAKNKSSFVISDPKGEIFAKTEKPLREAGYKIRLLNFKDPNHSDRQNIMTKMFDKWQLWANETNEIKKRELKADADQEIHTFIDNFFEVSNDSRQKAWDISAVNMLRSFIYAMLEDSLPQTKDGKTVPPKITRDNFSLRTLLTIFNSMGFSGSRMEDKGYFTNRPKDSDSYKLASGSFLHIADSTWKSVVFEVNIQVKKISSAAIQNLTMFNSFEYTDLAKEKTALFIRFSDSKKENYDMVEFFIRDIYSSLIEYADNNRGALDFPLYILLDEFGNLPPSQNFGNVISACRSRNIWFTLVIQSYSQLYGKYGNELADTIKDNCNIKCFFGTNDYQTLEAFSRECLHTTQIAFSSVFRSKSEELDTIDLETVPVVTVSELNAVKEGEFYIKIFRKNAMKSITVRSYECAEYAFGNTNPDAYSTGLNCDDAKYGYNPATPPPAPSTPLKNLFDDDF